MRNFNRDNKFGGRDFGRRDFGGGKPIMHKVICSDCGKECEVPFRPTGQRPVFCNDCFRNHRNRPGGNNTDQYKEQFAILNVKLDEILKVLNPEAKAVSKKKRLKKH